LNDGVTVSVDLGRDWMVNQIPIVCMEDVR